MPNRSSFRGRGRVGISQSQRRKKSWINVTAGTQLIDGSLGPTLNPNINIFVPSATSGGLFVGSSAGLFSDPVLDKVPAESTILRIRGSVNLPKNTVGLGAAGAENFAIGIGVMEATAASLGAFPNPATPEGGAWDGWMFYRSQQATSLDANAAIIDVKAMRKVQSGEAIIIAVGAFQTVVSGSSLTTEFNAQINLRALILLP